MREKLEKRGKLKQKLNFAASNREATISSWSVEGDAEMVHGNLGATNNTEDNILLSHKPLLGFEYSNATCVPHLFIYLIPPPFLGISPN